ncbi:MAG: tripartite tricarboxylate transporter substrate binding protein [Pseudorhodobacter sp.]|nr:tripartite tricarboxylate transporter substrate binding protein [Frankiaceae bacterium]
MPYALPVRTVLGLTLGLALSGCAGGEDASTADYPSQTIRFLVPYGAGGPTDLTSRVVGECLQQELGQTVVVENKPGGSGALATTELVGAAADGYSLSLVTAGTLVLTPLANEVGYTKDDVRPIGVMSEVPSLLAVGKDSPYQDAKAFIDAARARSGAIKVGVPGASTPQAIELRRLADEHDVEVTVVPFNGNAEMTTALLGGNVDAILINASADVVGNVDNGSFRPLAVSPEQRLPWLADTPTLTELGFDGLTLSGSTFGLAGPADLPDPVASTLESALRTCLDKPDVQDKIGKRYMTADFVDGAGLQQVLDDTQAVYQPMFGS